MSHNKISTCNGGMAGTVDDELMSEVSCLGSGLRLAKTEVGTRSFIEEEFEVAVERVEVVEVGGEGEMGRHFFRMASAAAAAACAFFFSSSSSGLEGGVSWGSIQKGCELSLFCRYMGIGRLASL